MRWCVAAGLFPPAIGGPATHAWDLAHELRRRGDEVTVVALGPTPPPTPFPVTMVPLSTPPALRMSAMAWALASAARRSDVIYATGGAWDAGLAATLASRLSRRPWIMRVSGDTAWERARNQGATSDSLAEFQSSRYGRRIEAFRAVQRWVVRDADAVIAPSRYLSSLVAGWGVDPARITVIHSGVDTTIFRRETAPTMSGELLVTVARCVPWKRLDQLLAMVALLPAAVRLVVIGSGPQQQALARRAAERGLEGRVAFAGDLDRVDVRAMLSAASLFVLNSEYEGLSHSLLEAMACGAPVVATDAGGNAEVIEDGVDGLLMPMASPGLMTDRIRELLQDPPQRQCLGEAARVKAGRFSVSSMTDRIQRLAASVARAR